MDVSDVDTLMVSSVTEFASVVHCRLTTLFPTSAPAFARDPSSTPCIRDAVFRPAFRPKWMDLFRFRSKTDTNVVLLCGVSGALIDPVSKLRKYLILRGKTSKSEPLWQ